MATPSVAQIDCLITGDRDEWPEAGTRCTFLLPHPVTAKGIEKVFPFEGKFHFRVKIAGDKVGVAENYVWMDLKAGDDKEVSFVANATMISVQALILELPSEYVDDSEYVDYLETMNQELGLNPSERPHRGSVDDGSGSEGKSLLKKFTKGMKKRTVAAAEVIGVNKQTVTAVAQGAASIWNKFVSKASEISSTLTQGGGSQYKDAAEEQLADLAADVTTGYNDANPEHMTLLHDLWDAQHFGPNFERVSDKWKEGGWQKPDPIADLKASGILAMRAMVYLGNNFPEKSQRMMQANKANVKTNYPFAVVGVNLTLLLAELLNLRDNK
jgi:hypothetical protein